ncbi:MAG: hypothetical protein WD904_06945 [Dehalococcoidia bacterium]
MLVTTSYDVGADYVSSALSSLGVAFHRLNTDQFPSETHITFDPQRDIVFSSGASRTTGSEVTAVWYRRIAGPNLSKDLDPGIREFCERECRAFITGTVSSLTPKRWLSAPWALALAEKKPYQLRIAHEVGFRIPETRMTNDPAAVAELGSAHKIAAKAVSSGYIQAGEGYAAIFTSEVSAADLQDLSSLSVSPVTFQELVDKVVDIRVTAVGQQLFAAEILSQTHDSSRTDWRATDDGNLEHRRHELPAQVGALCQVLVGKLGLHFAAIDLAVIQNGDYVFFELNPNGEWVWIEDQLGYPISRTIAEWLSGQAD